MKKFILVGIALLLFSIGTTQAIAINPMEGIAFRVVNMNDGSRIQVNVDGWFNSNGDGTYSITCPLNIPIELRNAVLTVRLYSGGVNQLIVKNGNVTVSYISQDSLITHSGDSGDTGFAYVGPSAWFDFNAEL